METKTRYRLLKRIPWFVIPFLLAILGSRTMGCADRLFFYPDREIHLKKEALPFPVRDVFFESTDGTKLHAWFCSAKTEKVKGVIFYCHGNAQNLSTHVRFIEWLPRAGYHVFIWDYRGYGLSEGTPTKRGLRKDTEAALETFLNLPEVKESGLPRIALGQSLGSAYASWIAAERPDAFDAVVLEGAFSRHRGIGAAMLKRNCCTYIFAWPVAWLLVSTSQDPVDNVRGIKVPLLVVHGKSDPIIPYRMGEEVFSAANEPKEFISHPGGHLCYPYEEEKERVRKGMLDFLDRHSGSR
ncbi:MAG: alpha/beta fold hydrolase [Planctomycetota bacterium]|nr:MAG: alpha/beta fold hydrolase [Planctomycetota bacterium]